MDVNINSPSSLIDHVKVSFFGGIDEIGGNKLLLADGDTRVFLDFGLSFASQARYFEFAIQEPANVDDLKKTSVIPELPGLYRGSSEERLVDGVLLSHAHADHSAHIPLLRSDIPVFTGRYTSQLLQIRGHTFGKSWDTDFEHLSFENLQTGKDAQIGGLSVRPYRVDHSVPGAHAFLISTSVGDIVYTGDLRLSGSRKSFTEDFIHIMRRRDIKYMFCEGTNIAPPDKMESHKLPNEEAVEGKANTLMGKEEGLIIYDSSPLDIDRIRTVSKVAKKQGRKLVLASRIGYILLETLKTKLIGDLPKKGEFSIYLGRTRVRGSGYDAYEEVGLEGRYFHERELAEDDSLMDSLVFGPEGREEILKHPKDYLIFTTNGITTLQQFKPLHGGIAGTYIYGKAEPFNEEMEMSFDRLLNWVKLCGMKLGYAHTSGHASRADLERIIKEISPEVLIPIHTEHADEVEKLATKLHVKVKRARPQSSLEFR
jgi:ribonuclease J